MFGGDGGGRVGWGKAVCLGVGLVGEQETEGERELVCSYTLSDSAISEINFVNNPLFSFLLLSCLIPFALFTLHHRLFL